MMRQGLFLSTRSLLAMGMLMWATRLIAGFGAVGLAGGPARLPACLSACWTFMAMQLCGYMRLHGHEATWP